MKYFRIKRMPAPVSICMFAFGLITSPAHSAEPPSATTGWSVCVPFDKAANAQKEITRADYERIIGDFKHPVKELVSPKRAAVIYLSAMNTAVKEMESWNWMSVKTSIDEIYKKKILAHSMRVDINNDGPTEDVIEFAPSAPGSAPSNYVMDEHGRLNDNFLMPNGHPESITGELVVYQDKTYLLTEWGRARRDDGRPTRQVMDVYRPQKNPMQAKGGIAEHGAGPLCEYKVLN